MLIKELKECIDTAFEYAPDANVEIIFKKKTYDLARVSQSGVIGDLYLEVGRVIFDESESFKK